MGLVKLNRPIQPNKKQVESRLNRTEDCCSFGIDYKQFIERYFMPEARYIYVGEVITVDYSMDDIIKDFDFEGEELVSINKLGVGEVANFKDGVQIKRVK